eukprot:CAMPEP_0194526872 /NCGR_PEP_ID=MMETSP0253-20130528/62790_1 /TAXON_ID=2966 /ORGANISM="Noctiluca scintillans" /LENGTH=33 /DNA_ID= /DNA_START= /DNA_END= /DNA_ORIENTATION=
MSATALLCSATTTSPTWSGVLGHAMSRSLENLG